MLKKLVLGLTMVVLSGVISNVSYAISSDPVAEVENGIKRELEGIESAGVDFEDVTIDLESDEVTIDAEARFDGEIINVEITSNISEKNIDGLSVKETIEGEESEYSLYFGTLEQKQQLEQAISEESLLLKDIENGKYSEEELENIELPTDKIFKDEGNHITTEEELENTPIVVTNLQTSEDTEIMPGDGIASNSYAIPVGIYITKQVATQLLKIFFAAVVGGILGIALTLVSFDAKYRRYYEHYRVVRAGRVGLVALGGMNLNTAVSYLKIGGDVWSTAQPLAWKVAYFAGARRGGKFQQPTRPEYHGAGNFWHHHTWNRVGGHSFYGVAARR